MTSMPPIRDLADTALWAAAFRARETERPDALFRDPLAARLAGSRGFGIADSLSTEQHSVSWVTRTFLFDQAIAREIDAGIDAVINLGAGLDTRPYRMRLPSSFAWIEVDSPALVAYKEDLLAREKPACQLERVALDLTDHRALRKLLSELRNRGKKILVLSEGVLVYLKPEEVARLASNLHSYEEFHAWVLELVSPKVVKSMQRTAGVSLAQSGACFQFGPAEGPSFFTSYGWELIEVRGVLRTAVKLGRTPIDPALLPWILDWPASGEELLPWIGVCLFRRREPIATN